jgi:hypothetical protein
MTNRFSIKRHFLPLACIAIAGLVSSCSMDFFATSWGLDAQRDPANIVVDAGNVFKLLKNARGDPGMSMAILDKIAEEIDGASASDKKTLREAALVAATQATDVASLVVSSIDTITEAMNSPNADVATLLDSITNSVDMQKTAHASADLVKILPDVDPSTGKFVDDFSASDSELMQATFVVILGQANKAGQDVGAYLEEWGKEQGGKYIDDPSTLNAEEKVIGGLMNKLIGQSSSPLATSLKEMMPKKTT